MTVRTKILGLALGLALNPFPATLLADDTLPPQITCAESKTVACGQPWNFDEPTYGDECVFDALVFDNATNDLRIRFNPGTAEIGDEIVLAGTARTLTAFVFEYYGLNTVAGYSFSGDVKARVRFYLNDGPIVSGAATPGTVIYDSGPFAIAATPRSTLLFDCEALATGSMPLDRELPDQFTWSVQFSDLGPNDEAGVDIYSPVVLGQDFDDYWEKANGTWELKANTVASEMNFAAQFYATHPLTLVVDSTVTNWFCGATYQVTRTWTVTDAGENHDSCSQTVTVVPALTCAPDKTVECGEAWSFDPPQPASECVFDSLVYDNATNDLRLRFNAGTAEIGDEINLAGTARVPEAFVFEYYGLNSVNGYTFSGDVKARVRFYLNDGPPVSGAPAPGTVIYDSGAFSVGATPRSTLLFDQATLATGDVPLAGPLPDILTWTVQFSGHGPNDEAGLDVYSPVVLGSSLPDYWERSGASWELKANEIADMNFAAQLYASYGDIVVTVLDTVSDALCGATYAATRTWVATDPCGFASATCSQTVTVLDTTAPVLTCPPNITVASLQALPAADFAGGTALDACDPNPAVTSVDVVVNATLVRRTYTALDACGNQANCTQQITIAPPQPICGDLDHDGDVDSADYNLFRSVLRTRAGMPAFNPEADYDGDGVISYFDYQRWYSCYKAYLASL